MAKLKDFPPKLKVSENPVTFVAEKWLKKKADLIGTSEELRDLRDSRDSKRGKRDKRENLLPDSPCSDHDVKWMVQYPVMCYIDVRNVTYVFCEKHSYLCTSNVNSC